MNKDELKEKADHLKERVKEAFGDNMKKAEAFIDRMRETVRQKTDKADAAQRDVVARTTTCDALTAGLLPHAERVRSAAAGRARVVVRAASGAQKLTVVARRRLRRALVAHASSGSFPQPSSSPQPLRQSWRPSARRAHDAPLGHGWLSSQLALQTPRAPTSAHDPVAHAPSFEHLVRVAAGRTHVAHQTQRQAAACPAGGRRRRADRPASGKSDR